MNLYLYNFRRKKEKSKEGKRPISNEGEVRGKGKKNQQEVEEPPLEEPPKDPKTEADLLLMQRFRTFEHGLVGIHDLCDHWERSTASIRPSTPCEGGAQEQEDHAHPPSGKKGKGRGKGSAKGGKSNFKKGTLSLEERKKRLAKLKLETKCAACGEKRPLGW